ncbi:MAG: SMC-Scp complex subunit ScpB [Planctomycetaceae bacterium]|nr:SMC-Scp complex subunit ScpB [Planctomycetaceae bacterium]
MFPTDDQNADANDMFPLEPDDDGVILSFDKLREVFANLSADDVDAKPDQAEPDGEPVVAESDFDENCEPYESIVASDGDRCELSPRTIFEAMLFVGNRENKPLAPERAAELMQNVSPEELVEIVPELNADYARVAAPYHIIREDDGYRMVLRPEFEPVRARFYNKTRETKLSQTAIDVLAIVAYRQPITADEVQKVRKSPSQTILQQLVRRGLIDTQKILNQKKTVTLYRTTNRFLQFFQLESIDDLPTAEEID